MKQIARSTAPTPRALGFRMPAEWEPHETTWIAWPHNRDDWPGRFAPIPWVYGEIVRRLAQVERVRILVENQDLANGARRILKKIDADLDAVEFFRCATNRSWTRDYGPIFVRNKRGEVAITNWNFNGWAKYDNWKHDNAVTAQLLHRTEQAFFCRQHRRQRTRLIAHDKRMPAQSGAGAQSQARPPRDRTRACRLPGRAESDLAAKRHRRR